jgi:hypothetical protein
MPIELSRLTFSEQLLISLAYPRCYIFKMYPKEGKRHTQHEFLQNGMKGNVSSYALNIQGISDMLQGALLPRPLAILPSLIAICFVGKGEVSKDWLKKTFKVRRRELTEALIWLKRHNPLYANIQISAQHIPQDDLPDEIRSTCRQETEPGIQEAERETYVPGDSDCTMNGETDEGCQVPGENSVDVEDDTGEVNQFSG